MLFKNQKYVIVKKAISKELALFINNYFLLKRQVANTLFSSTYISPFETMFGVWDDTQIPNTYSHYADNVMETLLLKVQPIVEKQTNLKLNPNYSYARIYKKGDELKKHKDRFSCEISTTLNLGGDLWSIYLEKESKKIKVDLTPGDMLIYKGSELEHWRNVFKGKECTQVFLHYNNVKTKNSDKNIFDRRPHLGLPLRFKKDE
jgi:hypothetical protein